MKDSTKSLFALLRWTSANWHERAGAASVRGSAAHKDLATLWKGYRRYYGRQDVPRKLREEMAAAIVMPARKLPISD